MILRAISVNKELQTPTNLFLASLALSDLFVNLSIPMQFVSNIVGNIPTLVHHVYFGHHLVNSLCDITNLDSCPC